MNKFHVGDNLFLHGKVGAYKYLQLLSPEYEVVQDDETNIKDGGIIPCLSAHRAYQPDSI